MALADAADAVPEGTFPGAMVAAHVALLVGALGFQLAFFGHGGHTSLSDLPRVLDHRQVGPGAPPYLSRDLEYPVGAGLLLYAATLVAPGPLAVLLVTALAAGAVSVAITVALQRRWGGRAWRWAIGTPVFFFAFQNWDVFAVGALLLGLLAFTAGRKRLAGAALGSGAAIKLFPAAVVPPFAAQRWAAGDRRGALSLGLSAGAVLLLLNLPFLVLNRAGWWWTFDFQGRRPATWGSAWWYLYRLADLPVHGARGASFANAVALVALAGGLGWVTVVGVRRNLAPFAVAAAAVTVFVLCNKVYSPTYDLWLVVFFIALPVSRRLWLAFCGVDLAIYATVYGYFHGLDSAGFTHAVLPFLVAARTAVLVLLVAGCTRAPRRAGVDGEATTAAVEGIPPH